MIDKLQVVERKSEMERLTGISDGEEETIINLQIKPERKKGGWVTSVPVLEIKTDTKETVCSTVL